MRRLWAEQQRRVLCVCCSDYADFLRMIIQDPELGTWEWNEEEALKCSQDVCRHLSKYQLVYLVLWSIEDGVLRGVDVRSGPNRVLSEAME